MIETTEFPARYTNDITEEALRQMNKPHYSEEQLASMPPLSAEVVRENQTYHQRHPIIGIHRVATEGSRSQLGGEIRKGSLDMQINLPSGETVNVAIVGDEVHYPDGSTTRIVTGAGEHFFNAALVGSRLENGDEIVDTPQDGVVLTARQGIQLSNFLSEVGGK